jgi:hypothetical protein
MPWARSNCSAGMGVTADIAAMKTSTRESTAQ